MTLFHRKQNISSDLMEFFLAGNKVCARALCMFFFFWLAASGEPYVGWPGSFQRQTTKRVTLNE